jgi:hypothetical protein
LRALSIGEFFELPNLFYSKRPRTIAGLGYAVAAALP